MATCPVIKLWTNSADSSVFFRPVNAKKLRRESRSEYEIFIYRMRVVISFRSFGKGAFALRKKLKVLEMASCRLRRNPLNENGEQSLSTIRIRDFWSFRAWAACMPANSYPRIFGNDNYHHSHIAYNHHFRCQQCDDLGAVWCGSRFSCRL